MGEADANRPLAYTRQRLDQSFHPKIGLERWAPAPFRGDKVDAHRIRRPSKTHRPSYQTSSTNPKLPADSLTRSARSLSPGQTPPAGSHRPIPIALLRAPRQPLSIRRVSGYDDSRPARLDLHRLAAGSVRSSVKISALVETASSSTSFSVNASSFGVRAMAQSTAALHPVRAARRASRRESDCAQRRSPPGSETDASACRP